MKNLKTIAVFCVTIFLLSFQQNEITNSVEEKPEIKKLTFVTVIFGANVPAPFMQQMHMDFSEVITSIDKTCDRNKEIWKIENMTYSEFYQVAINLGYQNISEGDLLGEVIDDEPVGDDDYLIYQGSCGSN